MPAGAELQGRVSGALGRARGRRLSGVRPGEEKAREEKGTDQTERRPRATPWPCGRRHRHTWPRSSSITGNAPDADLAESQSSPPSGERRSEPMEVPTVTTECPNFTRVDVAD